MDELVMTIAATARETRVLLMHGPDEVMKARLRAVATPAHRFAAPMLCEAMALWHDKRVRAVVSAESEEVLFVLGLCDGFGIVRATLHYVVQFLFMDELSCCGQRLAGFGNFRGEHRLRRAPGHGRLTGRFPRPRRRAALHGQERRPKPRRVLSPSTGRRRGAAR